jgi:hypothetical protein
VVSVLATGPKVRGFDPVRGRRIFKCDKNPEHHFLRRVSKAVSPMSYGIYGHEYNSKISHPKSDCLPDGSGSHIRIE